MAWHVSKKEGGNADVPRVDTLGYRKAALRAGVSHTREIMRPFHGETGIARRSAQTLSVPVSSAPQARRAAGIKMEFSTPGPSGSPSPSSPEGTQGYSPGLRDCRLRAGAGAIEIVVYKRVRLAPLKLETEPGLIEGEMRR